MAGVLGGGKAGKRGGELDHFGRLDVKLIADGQHWIYGRGRDGHG